MENETNTMPPDQPEILLIQSKPKRRFIALLVILGIAITGYFVSAKYLNLWLFSSKMSVSIPTFTPRPTANPTPTYQIEDWLIYSRDKYGITLTYPNSWVASPFANSEDTSVFGPQNCNYIYLGHCGSLIIHLPPTWSTIALFNPKDYLLDYWSKNNLTLLDQQALTINGLTAYRIIYKEKKQGKYPEGSLVKRLAIKNKDKIYDIEYSEYLSPNQSILFLNDWRFDKIFEQMLATLKFAKPKILDFSLSETYHDSEFGFEFKYPKAWIDDYDNENRFNDIFGVSNYENIEPGPSAFYVELSKDTWKSRLNNKPRYKIGDNCFDEDIGAPTTDRKEVTCFIFSLDPYVIKEEIPGIITFSIETDNFEINFSAYKNFYYLLSDNIMKSVLSAFKFIGD